MQFCLFYKEVKRTTILVYFVMNNNAGGRVGGKIRGQHCIFGERQPNSVGGGNAPLPPPPLATGLFTRRLPGLKFLSYRERLENLKLQSLEHRRLITDLIACFNIVHGLNSLSFNDFFTKATNPSSRGHSLRLLPPLVKTIPTKHFSLPG